MSRINEVIEKLGKAKANIEHIDDYCHTQRELFDIRKTISEPIGQALSLLKKIKGQSEQLQKENEKLTTGIRKAIDILREGG